MALSMVGEASPDVIDRAPGVHQVAFPIGIRRLSIGIVRVTCCRAWNDLLTGTATLVDAGWSCSGKLGLLGLLGNQVLDRRLLRDAATGTRVPAALSLLY